MRAFVVLNPVAGLDDGTDVRAVIEMHLARAGWEVEIHETTESEDVTERTREALAGNYDIFVAAGGDGTVSAVAAALVSTDRLFGVLPTGSGNGLARELGIPLTLPAALALLTEKHGVQVLDVMEVVGHGYFFLNLSMGISACAMRDTTREEKRRFGWLAYLWNGSRALLGFQPVTFVLTIDDEISKVNAADVLVANLGSVGMPSIRLAPEITFEDGELDVITMRARTLWDYLRTILAILIRQQRRTPHLQAFRARKYVRIDSLPPQPVQADGEFLGLGPVEVRVVPAAVRIITPITKTQRNLTRNHSKKTA